MYRPRCLKFLDILVYAKPEHHSLGKVLSSSICGILKDNQLWILCHTSKIIVLLVSSTVDIHIFSLGKGCVHILKFCLTHRPTYFFSLLQGKYGRSRGACLCWASDIPSLLLCHCFLPVNKIPS